MFAQRCESSALCPRRSWEMELAVQMLESGWQNRLIWK